VVGGFAETTGRAVPSAVSKNWWADITIEYAGMRSALYYMRRNTLVMVADQSTG